ncbi:MAG: DUF4389 domain-containing protein [Chloroflexi bacterium]|nr:DUF4389 domain-containing protein [Chloroflexota bacterium]
MTAEKSNAYPATPTINYPDRKLSKLTTFLGIFVAIPILIVVGLLVGASFQRGDTGGLTYQYATAGVVILPTLLMILFRQKYPRWSFDWNLALTRFVARVGAYLMLLRDEYPSTDEEQAVHLEITYPDAERDLNRWLPLVKWFLAIPHFFVLFFLGIAIMACTVIAWFAILFSGRYPSSLFDFVVGVFRWSLRVEAYALLLTTDRYPPFALSQ